MHSSHQVSCLPPAETNQPDHDGLTALHRAVQTGDSDRVKQLIDDGADVEALTLSGDSALHLAAELGHTALLPLLITPATLNKRNLRYETPLTKAWEHNQVDTAAALVAAGAFLDPGGTMPLLHKACAYGPTPAFPLQLLDAMMSDQRSPGLVAREVCRKDHGGHTPLHWAACSGRPELVTRLLELGADRDTLDKYGAYPLWYATLEEDRAQLVPLLATPANIDAVRWGHTSLWYAAAQGIVQTAAALLAAGAAPDTCDKEGRSALRMAMQHGHTQVMRLLLTALAKSSSSSSSSSASSGGDSGGSSSSQEKHSSNHTQQQQGQPKLVRLVAADLAPLARRLEGALRCAQVLGVVLDVLGLELAEQVCQAVQQQLQQEREQAADLTWLSGTYQASYLAEALLLGCAGAEEQLHAARQPVVARLQHLVPELGPLDEQGQKGEGPQGSWEQQETALDIGQLQQLKKQMAQAAAAGEEQRAISLLEEVAALYFSVQQQQQRKHCQGSGTHSSLGPHQRPRAVLQQSASHHTQGSSSAAAQTDACPSIDSQLLVQQGLQEAAELRHLPEQGCSDAASLQDKWQARSFHPPGVYGAFLASWVGVRRQLQQLPQEKVATVVAAVQAAREQRGPQRHHRHHHHQQQQEEEETPVPKDLPSCRPQANGLSEPSAPVAGG
jgi:ankyrin repeat protein